MRLVGLDHSMTHVVVGSCQGEIRTSELIGISPAEEGWTVANDNEMYLVAALTCNVLQQGECQYKNTAAWSRFLKTICRCNALRDI
jgi:hypothetical protein